MVKRVNIPVIFLPNSNMICCIIASIEVFIWKQRLTIDAMKKNRPISKLLRMTDLPKSGCYYQNQCYIERIYVTLSGKDM